MTAAPTDARSGGDALARLLRAHTTSGSHAASHRGARGAGAAVVADACAYAWLQLVRRPDIRLDRGGFAWLALVADPRGLAAQRARPRAARRPVPGRDRPRTRARPSPPGPPATRSSARSTASNTTPASTRFAGLKPRERRDLLLQAGGYTYHEIAALTASTYTAVNRRLTEGRAACAAN